MDDMINLPLYDSFSVRADDPKEDYKTEELLIWMIQG